MDNSSKLILYLLQVDFLRSRGRHQVEKSKLTQCAIDICDGMKFLEMKNVVHRDLAARNVLLDGELTAKISDFGLAKDANDCQLAESTLSKFPIKWTAPEALRYSVSCISRLTFNEKSVAVSTIFLWTSIANQNSDKRCFFSNFLFLQCNESIFWLIYQIKIPPFFASFSGFIP